MDDCAWQTDVVAAVPQSAHARFNLGMSQVLLADDYDDVVENFRAAAQLYVQQGDLHGSLLATANLGACISAQGHFSQGAAVLPPLLADIIQASNQDSGRQDGRAGVWDPIDGALLSLCYSVIGGCCHALHSLPVRVLGRGPAIPIVSFCLFELMPTWLAGGGAVLRAGFGCG